MNFCMKTRFAMYYLCQHQFSQLALLTEQILLCLFMGKAMHGSAPLGTLYCGGAPQGTMPITQASGFARSRSHPPFVRLYPWDGSKFPAALSPGDARRCVKPDPQEPKRSTRSLGPHWWKRGEKATFWGEIRWIWDSGNFLFIFLRARHR